MGGFLLNPHRLAPVASETYLYNAGDECSALTGGWSVSSYRTTHTTVHTVAENAGNVTLTVKAGTTAAGQMAYTHATAVDLTNYTTLHLLGHIQYSDDLYAIAVDSTQKSGAWGTGSFTTWVDGYTTSAATTETEITLDVSAFNGSYYVYMLASKAYTTSRESIGTFTKIWLT